MKQQIKSTVTQESVKPTNSQVKASAMVQIKKAIKEVSKGVFLF